MDRDFENEPWCGLLADAAPRDHIVQLYQDEKFLSRAVCRFAVSAINHGEGVILVPTSAHWNALRPRLEAEGVDVKAAQACGQLTVVDADQLLPDFMRDAMPDAPLFLGLAGETIAKARGGDRFTKVRWWGEMVNVLWERGDVAASMGLEDLFHKLAYDQEIAIFCSFLMDNFDGDVHARMLPRLGQNHSHLIPVEDYARLERAVAGRTSRIGGACSRLASWNSSFSRAMRRRSICHGPKPCSWLCGMCFRSLPTRYCREAVICTTSRSKRN